MTPNSQQPAPDSPDTSADVVIPAELLAAPKIALHDHLDGGLRPATMIELADEIGHTLPATDPEKLAAWFAASAGSGSLERYLETFDHTVAVMRTADGLARVAREAVLDLAADGVVYAELRWAPEQHAHDGLSLDAVVEAVQSGLDDGVAAASAQGRTIVVGQLITAMRHADRSIEIAELTVRWFGRGVVGFDIAGAEAGFPPGRFAEAFSLLRRAYVPLTIHAGEAAGPESIAEAITDCGADRIGHGVRVIEDIDLTGDEPRLGALSVRLRDRQVALELCPSSNLQTGAASSIATHPITELRRLGFAVTVNTDNRLVSATTASREMALLVDQAGWTMQDLTRATVQAADAAFGDIDVRRALVRDVILPGWSRITL